MIIDHIDKTISIKLVYFGPAFSGKTTSIKALFSHFGKDDALHSIESTVNRTLFFDYGTVTFQNQEWKLKLHIYSTTGQDFYIITRPVTLQAIDGIIFVADSLQEAYYRNLTSWNELCNYFEDVIITLPKLIAFNKQDLAEKFCPAVFLDNINYFKFKNIDFKKTIALNGEGILDSFEEILSLVFKNLYKSQIISALQ